MSKEKQKINTIPFYSEEDGEVYPLPWIAPEGLENSEEIELEDGSLVDYDEGFISALFTGPRVFTYEFDFEKRVMLEYELLGDGEAELLIRTMSIDFFNYWNRFSCNQNTYITDKGEEIHFCLHNPEPIYEGKIVKIISPDGEEVDLMEEV